MPFFRTLLLFVLISPALAAAEALRLVADRWPPFTDQSLPGNGLTTELVSTALSRAGYQSRYIEVPWARAISGLKSADYDVVVGAWYSRERQAFAYLSQPYFVNRIRLLQRKGDDIPFSELADLYPYRIAVSRGYAYSDAFDNDMRLHKVAVVGFTNAARMLHAGRVQLTLEDEYVARYHLNRELRWLRDEIEFVAQPLSDNDLHILIRRSHPEHRSIARRFDQAIEAMKEDGSYAAILKRHGF